MSTRRPEDKATPRYYLRDFDLTGPEGRIDLVHEPANGEPNIAVLKSLRPDGDGGYITSKEDVEIGVEHAFALSLARVVHKMITVGTPLAETIREVLPMHVGHLRLLDELLHNMINPVPEVRGEGTLDSVIREMLGEMASMFLAASRGQEPMEMSASPDELTVEEKAGRVLNTRNRRSLIGLMTQALQLVKDADMYSDLLEVLAEIFGESALREKEAADADVHVAIDAPTVQKNADILAMLHEELESVKSRVGVLEKGGATRQEKHVYPNLGTEPGDYGDDVNKTLDPYGTGRPAVRMTLPNRHVQE